VWRRDARTEWKPSTSSVPGTCSSTTSLVQAHKSRRQPGPHPGDAAATAAAVLRDYPYSAGHIDHLTEDRTCDLRIRQAVRQVSGHGRIDGNGSVTYPDDFMRSRSDVIASGRTQDPVDYGCGATDYAGG
jgi:hypothetical protein